MRYLIEHCSDFLESKVTSYSTELSHSNNIAWKYSMRLGNKILQIFQWKPCHRTGLTGGILAFMFCDIYEGLHL